MQTGSEGLIVRKHITCISKFKYNSLLSPLSSLLSPLSSLLSPLSSLLSHISLSRFKLRKHKENLDCR
ncbi:hypothetical protein Bca101_083310 [Brassica carinata]